MKTSGNSKWTPCLECDIREALMKVVTNKICQQNLSTLNSEAVQKIYLEARATCAWTKWQKVKDNMKQQLLCNVNIIMQARLTWSEQERMIIAEHRKCGHAIAQSKEIIDQILDKCMVEYIGYVDHEDVIKTEVEPKVVDCVINKSLHLYDCEYCHEGFEFEHQYKQHLQQHITVNDKPKNWIMAIVTDIDNNNSNNNNSNNNNSNASDSNNNNSNNNNSNNNNSNNNNSNNNNSNASDSNNNNSNNNDSNSNVNMFEAMVQINKIYFRSNVRKISSTGSKCWQCIVCHKKLSTKYNTEIHVARKHSTQAQQIWPCSQCDQKFACKYLRNVHRRKCRPLS